jgi:hypothetical protein
MLIRTLLAALGLALVHVLGTRLRFLAVSPRSRWLSASGGVSVAYVFVHLLPELSERQEVFERAAILAFVEHHIYVMALIGLCAFYGLQQVVRQDQIAEEQDRLAEGNQTAESGHSHRSFSHSNGVFWLHICSFALYNALIGYLLAHREEPGRISLFIFFSAMALHFVVNDHGLRAEHQDSYDRVGRWVLSAAVLAGWAVGVLTEVRHEFVAVLFAFLAGGIVLNVLKEELPEERRSRFWAFALGAAAYTILLLLL